MIKCGHCFTQTSISSERQADGPDVLTWFELRTATSGPLPIVNWSHAEDGLITRIQVTFDPRPILR